MWRRMLVRAKGRNDREREAPENLKTVGRNLEEP